MNKQLIKDAIKEMIRDGEIVITKDSLPTCNYLDSVETKGDVEDMIDWMEFRLEVVE